MREFIKSIGFIGGCLFFIPLLIVYAGGYQNTQLLSNTPTQISNQVTVESAVDVIEESQLIGILAKEIPYTYEYEAIKAQAVVIRTYMLRRILGMQNQGVFTSYSLEELQELWGENYQAIYKTYQEAVQETQNEIIVYQAQPIEALYHKASAEKTRSAKDVYQLEVPYLQSVEGEKHPISEQIRLSKSDIVNQLKEIYPDMIVEETLLENQIQIVERDPSEYVKYIQIGNTMITGEEFRKLIGLPSSHFKIFHQDKVLVFDVKGSGHGVGLSQNGSNELAKSSKDYKEIITHYYTNVEVQKYLAKK